MLLRRRRTLARRKHVDRGRATDHPPARVLDVASWALVQEYPRRRRRRARRGRRPGTLERGIEHDSKLALVSRRAVDGRSENGAPLEPGG